MAKTMEEVATLLKNTRFKKQIFGGVDRADLWTKLERLQKEYEEVILVERLKNEAIIEEKEKRIEYLENMLKGLK